MEADDEQFCAMHSEWCFCLFDVNGDCGLDKPEFAKFCKCMLTMFEQEMTDDQIGEKFSAADADNDGQVSLEEFKKHKKDMKPMMKEWAAALKEKCMANEKFVKMLCG